MDKSIYQQYLETSAQIKALEESKEVLSKLCIAKMTEENTDRADVPDWGVITRQQRTAWEYTNKVKEAEGKVKDLKAKEVESGVAKEKITEYIKSTLK
jgi:hypothetical protein